MDNEEQKSNEMIRSRKVCYKTKIEAQICRYNADISIAKMNSRLIIKARDMSINSVWKDHKGEEQDIILAYLDARILSKKESQWNIETFIERVKLKKQALKYVLEDINN